MDLPINACSMRWPAVSTFRSSTNIAKTVKPEALTLMSFKKTATFSRSCELVENRKVWKERREKEQKFLSIMHVTVLPSYRNLYCVSKGMVTPSSTQVFSGREELKVTAESAQHSLNQNPFSTSRNHIKVI